MPPPVCNTSNIRNLRNEVSFNDAERSEANFFVYRPINRVYFGKQSIYFPEVEII